MVKISIVAPDGQETLVSLLGPGEPFGEMAILDGQPRSATATAMARTETIYVPRDGFIRFLDEHPSAMRKIIAMLSRRLRTVTDHLADLVFHDVYGRLAKKLLELGETHGQTLPNGQVEIRLPLTQQDLANLVGASRESVNKVIKLYRDKGMIAVQSHRITLVLPRELQRRAELG
jgi:CRP-like cAMP-binding protein